MQDCLLDACASLFFIRLKDPTRNKEKDKPGPLRSQTLLAEIETASPWENMIECLDLVPIFRFCYRRLAGLTFWEL
jgi:hypothetical protein